LLYLRVAVNSNPEPVIETRANPKATWTPLPSTLAGADVLGTPFRGLGDYAVVRRTGSTTVKPASSLTFPRVALLVGGILLLLALTITVLRRLPGSDATSN
jgi:hypothetical protein